MSRHMKIVFCVSYVIAAVLAFLPPYLVHRNRYRTHDQFAREEAAEQLERDIKWMYANAKTPDEKLRVKFEDRIARPGDYEKERKRIRVIDGVDQFEAWMLAHEYFGQNFGICGGLALPVREDDRWRVPVAIGSSARPGTIWIDAGSGHATSDTLSIFGDAAKGDQPNQALEPTAPSGRGSP
jgi:hypothetical protein